MTDITTLYIKKGTENLVLTVDNLKETTGLTIGQVFFAVAKHFDKEPSSYPRWLSFRDHNPEYRAIEEVFNTCETDMDKFDLICNWLGEENIT
jgi:hypothetical protein